ncbi:hypothetical protein BpHYR1_030392 [Brachionus plicatilis]|uniref:Uncharacterized protein n=1 Tax=Brachionus plicatilis TaxID=10195 RepID=A0A3M7QN28_BRAPC|nr:hypothetical protein BpHYR1_030392 [Brachionus plicatilis]
MIFPQDKSAMIDHSLFQSRKFKHKKMKNNNKHPQIRKKNVTIFELYNELAQKSLIFKKF